MAKLSNSLSLCLWYSFLVLGSCFTFREQPQQNECQLDQLESLQPDNVIKSEAGRVETWNPNHKQFRCAGVALTRCILEQHALKIPSYSNSPQLIYIQRGRGMFGIVIPGCANTYEEAQLSESGKIWRSRDRHQKIRQFEQGDLIAVPPGLAFWMYNNENDPVEAISLLDTSNYINQLDRMPRKFYLAGNHEQEFLRYQQQQLEEEERQHGSHQEGQQQQRGSDNVVSAFDRALLAQALNTDEEIVGEIQQKNVKSEGGIIRVSGSGLHIFHPPSRTQRPRKQKGEQEDEELEGEEQQQSKQQERGQEGREGESGSDNGLEETLCSLRLHQNIGPSASPDIHHPQAGSLKTVTSYDLRVLKLLKLSAEFGSIRRNALYVPHYNLNAHSIVYALEGRAEVQVVDSNGKLVYNQELRQGEVLTVPQNYAVAIRSESNQFSFVAFKTHDMAMMSTLAEQMQAWPEEVVACVYRLRREQARQLKNNIPLHYLLPPQQSRRPVA
ncbi:legumin A-like [Prosopis cineraria]|uniref:legumin A-like n=1 Tax=Prosopis cineraria TaxID=364024 RepID=UPI00240EF211|nr:legumin A-like [Prosopis cineraria]